jgi:hypothetical protein
MDCLCMTCPPPCAGGARGEAPGLAAGTGLFALVTAPALTMTGGAGRAAAGAMLVLPGTPGLAGGAGRPCWAGARTAAVGATPALAGTGLAAGEGAGRATWDAFGAGGRAAVGATPALAGTLGGAGRPC